MAYVNPNPAMNSNQNAPGNWKVFDGKKYQNDGGYMSKIDLERRKAIITLGATGPVHFRTKKNVGGSRSLYARGAVLQRFPKETR